MPAALAFVAIAGLLELSVVAGLFGRGAAMLGQLAATWLPWLPWLLVFAVTWVTGKGMSTMPWPKPVPPAESHA